MLEIATHRHPKLQSIASLLDALHEHGISYCNLKCNDYHLKNAMSGESDIDVLFDKRQRSELDLLLTSLGFKRFQAIHEKQYLDIADYFALDATSGKIIHLHTYFGYTIGEPFLKGYQPHIADKILQGRIYNEKYGIYCISPALEFVLLYLNETLKLRNRDAIRFRLRKRKTFSEKAVRQHNWLKSRVTPEDIDLCVRTYFDDSVAIHQLVNADFKPDALRRQSSIMRQEVRKWKLYSTMSGLVERWRRELSVKIRRKLSALLELPILCMRTNPRGGTIVAILERGDDGLSSITPMIKESYSKKLDVYKVTFRPFNRISFAPHSTLKTLRYCLDAVYFAFDKWIRLMCVNAARAKGILVICDHYPLHPVFHNVEPALRHLMNSRNPIFRMLSMLEDQLFRKSTRYHADLIFDFVPLQSPEIAQTPYDDYMALLGLDKAQSTAKSALPTRIVSLDTGKPLSEILYLIKDEIWKEL